MRFAIRLRALPATVFALAILGCGLLGLTACNCCQEEEEAPVTPTAEVVPPVADDWLVVHQNRKPGSSTPGGALDECTVQAGLEVTCLPSDCLFIYVGKKIGFANYYNDATTGGAPVIVELPPGAFAVNQITLAYQETRILEVKTKPTAPVLINLKLVATGPGHGGPAMIPVDPPTGP